MVRWLIPLRWTFIGVILCLHNSPPTTPVFNTGNSSCTTSAQVTKKWKITCLAYFKRMDKRSRKGLWACPLTSPPSRISLPTACNWSASSPRLLLPRINSPETAPNISHLFSFFFFFLKEFDSWVERHPPPLTWPPPKARTAPWVIAGPRFGLKRSLWLRYSDKPLQFSAPLVAIDHSPWAAGARVACRYLQSAPLPGSPASDPGRG